MKGSLAPFFYFQPKTTYFSRWLSSSIAALPVYLPMLNALAFDGETFSAGIKALGIAPLIGKQTAGAVCGYQGVTL